MYQLQFHTINTEVDEEKKLKRRTQSFVRVHPAIHSFTSYVCRLVFSRKKFGLIGKYHKQHGQLKTTLFFFVPNGFFRGEKRSERGACRKMIP